MKLYGFYFLLILLSYNIFFFTETQTSEYDAIVSGVIGNGVPCDLDLFSAYTKLLRAKGGGAALIVKTDEASDASEKTIVKRLKMCGFVNVAPGASSGTVVGYTPAYEVQYALFFILFFLKIARMNVM